MRKIAETDVKSVAKRVTDKVKGAMKKIGDVLDDLGNPRKNIDNPEGTYYAQTDEYWQAREASIKADEVHAASIKDAIDKKIER